MGELIKVGTRSPSNRLDVLLCELMCSSHDVACHQCHMIPHDVTWCSMMPYVVTWCCMVSCDVMWYLLAVTWVPLLHYLSGCGSHVLTLTRSLATGHWASLSRPPWLRSAAEISRNKYVADCNTLSLYSVYVGHLSLQYQPHSCCPQTVGRRHSIILWLSPQLHPALLLPLGEQASRQFWWARCSTLKQYNCTVHGTCLQEITRDY